MGKFKNGLLFGGVLGAAVTWLNTTTQGKKTRDEIVAHTAEVYTKLTEEIKSSDTWKQITESEYAERVQAFVDRYAVETGISDKVASLVKKMVIAQWKRFKQEDTRN